MNYDRRVSRLENSDLPGESPEYVTINVRFVDTIVDPDTDQRREVEVPATYSDDVPFVEQSPGRFFRVRWPVEERSADRVSADQSAKTRVSGGGNRNA